MLGRVLRERRDEVLEIARDRLRAKIPDRPENDVLDHLPGVVDDVIEELESPRETGLARGEHIRKLSAAHGRQREQLGIDLSHVANDYGVVCDAIAEVAKRHDLHVPAVEWQTLNRAVDTCIAAAISSYQDQSLTKMRRQAALHVGGVAHELRNSLMVMQTAFDALRNGRVGVTSRTSDVLERNLRYLSVLANDLLGESRANADVPVARERIQLGAFLDELTVAIPKREGVRVETAVEPDVTVVADRQLLTSAVTNLLQNALKFTIAGGRVVLRGCRAGNEVLIEVEDQCGGLPEGKVEALFAPFVQQSANRSGLGLGLWLVHRVMTTHGGSVRARNIPGQGCVFMLSLPAAADVNRR